MSDPRAFISFDFDHNALQKNLFVGQSKNSKTPFSIQDWSAKSAMPQNEWEAIVEEKIKKTNMVIVLVGRYMASAVGVKKEIKMAKNNNIPVFGVYVDSANLYSNLPDGLLRSRVVKWDWEKIAGKIDEMMIQGKNI
ncbi:TPA: TIR domain-containing protein [Bacillus cereus]|nr:TIR domain-containing protein [Bacillus cereus]